MVWPLDSKYFRNFSRISALFMTAGWRGRPRARWEIPGMILARTRPTRRSPSKRRSGAEPDGDQRAGAGWQIEDSALIIGDSCPATRTARASPETPKTMTITPARIFSQA